MANTPQLGSYGDLSGSSLMFRNKLINGGFAIWQRGTSQTGDGYGSDDRWFNGNSGTTKTASRQTFTFGQTDVPGNPQYFSRTVVTSVAGSGNYAMKEQRVENVSTFSGQTCVFSFWAKADATKNVAVEFIQNFGSGGSPSSTVAAIGVTTVQLTTSWARYSVVVNVPSVSGKTIGTSLNDFFSARWWFDAGSSFNARTNSLGQQSGTFDIANVQLEAGSIATPFEQRPISTELQLCQRYYEKSYNIDVAPGTSTNLGVMYQLGATDASNNIGLNLCFKVQKRVTPIAFVAFTQAGGDGWQYGRSGASGTIATASLNTGFLGAWGGLVYGTVGAAWVAAWINGHWVVTAEI